MGVRWVEVTNAASIPDGVGASVAQLGPIDVAALGTVEQSMLLAGATVLVAVVVLGLVPRYGSGVIETSHRSPLISLCIGLPSTAALATLGYMGALIADTDLGVFFAIPLIAVSVTPLVVSTAVGFVALGGFLGARLGVDRRWAWLVMGASLSGIAVPYPAAGVALIGLAASLGVGAGARVAFNGGAVGDRGERAIPPANKV